MSSSERAPRGGAGAVPARCTQPARRSLLRSLAAGLLAGRAPHTSPIAASFAGAFYASLAATLAGCGFALRAPPHLAFTRIALSGFAADSSLGAELRRQLSQQVQVVGAPGQADLVLEALADRRETNVAASTAFAEVRELQLRLRFDFRVRAPSGRELVPAARLLLTRDLSYRETAVLAKEEEEAALFRAMERDVVAQVLRRLASVTV